MYQQNQSPALVAAKVEEALTHGQVMYGLIKPTKDMKQVESTAALVNVIPRKRIYRMMKADELDLFTAELMKRPLVLQPSAYIGRGIAALNCTLCMQEEQWLLMVNQTHPKIIGNIQAGIAGAKHKMALGEPFVLEFSFNSFLKRVYLDRLTKAALSPRFTVIDFESAEIIIRYPGNAAHRGIAWEMKTPELKFTFDELLPGDLTRRTVRDGTIEWQQPALRIVPPSELSQYLPGWNFAEDDLIPLPTAPPLYESDEELEGATGGYDLENDRAPLSSGRMVGRRGRDKTGKGGDGKIDVQIDIHNNSRQYDELPIEIELHVPQIGGPQVLQRGNTARTPSPTCPPSPPPPAYIEAIKTPSYNEPDHSVRSNDQKYDDNRLPISSIPKQSPRGSDSLQHQQYLMQGLPRDVPRTSTALQHDPAIDIRTPTTHSSGIDRYGHAPSSHSKTESNDDGGFLSHSRHQPGGKLDANSNRTGEVDRYGNPVNNQISPTGERQSHGYNEQTVNRDLQRGYPVSPTSRQKRDFQQDYPTSPTSRQTYSPRDTDQYNRGHQYPSATRDHPVPAARRKPGFVPLDHPEALPRGLHHHQGSGRSVSSTSDSGFGETENGLDSSKHRTDASGDHGLQQQKNPHYNHAYIPESPERSPIREQGSPSMDDIMAQHKALAARMLQGDVAQDVNNYHHGYNQHDNRNHGDYNKELQRYRRNINDLEDACDVPDVDFSQSRLQLQPQDEQMEESFI